MKTIDQLGIPDILLVLNTRYSGREKRIRVGGGGGGVQYSSKGKRKVGYGE